MAIRDEKSDENSRPQTLADLWLRSRPSRPSRSAEEREPPPPKPASSPPPMGPLFTPSHPPPPPHPASSPAQMALLSTASPPPPAESHSPSAPATTVVRKHKPPEDSTAAINPVASQPAGPHTPPERRIWTVRDLVTGIRQHVEQQYQDIWVEGEISNCRPAPSGHIYFTLKDGEAQLPVVLFRRQALLLRFRPENLDGLAILAKGRVS